MHKTIMQFLNDEFERALQSRGTKTYAQVFGDVIDRAQRQTGLDFGISYDAFRKRRSRWLRKIRNGQSVHEKHI